jgi:hypothetical protein
MKKTSKFIPLTKFQKGTRGVDITGYSSGRLTILRLHGKQVYPSGSQVFLWRAICSCGNETVVNGQHFMNGNVQSCGCLLQERAAASRKGKKPKRPGIDLDLPTPMDLTAKEMVERGKYFRKFEGMQIGELTVGPLVKGIIYWHASQDNKKGERRLRKSVVTHWSCVCSCGNSVIRTSSNLAKKLPLHACNKCLAYQSRNTKFAISSK